MYVISSARSALLVEFKRHSLAAWTVGDLFPFSLFSGNFAGAEAVVAVFSLGAVGVDAALIGPDAAKSDHVENWIKRWSGDDHHQKHGGDRREGIADGIYGKFPASFVLELTKFSFGDGIYLLSAGHKLGSLGW